MEMPKQDFPPQLGERLTGRQINWNQVFYFTHVAACESIKEAAEVLGMNPSTISEHIAQLERDLEVLLFHRQHRKLRLTREGARLFLHAKEMFEASQRMIDVVSPVPLGCYPLAVGIVASPSIQLGYDLLASYLKRFGPIGMKLIHSKHPELETALAQAQLDFGFSDRPPERRDIVHRRVARSRLRFYVSLEWSAEPLPALLRKLPLLISAADPAMRTLAEQALLSEELIPASVVTSACPGTLVDLCQRGVGIGVFSERLVNKLNFESTCSLHALEGGPDLQDHLFLLWHKDAENTAAVKHLMRVLPPEGRFGTA